MHQLQTDMAISVLWSTFFKYGIPFLLLSIVLQYISTRISKRRKTRRTWKPSFTEPPELAPLSALKLTSRRPLTTREENMFFALTAALPECTVLAQVSFQALLDTSDLADRNRFNRKHADFVICSKRLTPIAVLELDDATHDTRGEEDADRDAMLQNAGYQTIRYRNIPTAEQIQADIETALQKLTAN